MLKLVKINGRMRKDFEAKMSQKIPKKLTNRM